MCNHWPQPTHFFRDETSIFLMYAIRPFILPSKNFKYLHFMTGLFDEVEKKSCNIKSIKRYWWNIQNNGKIWKFQVIEISLVFFILVLSFVSNSCTRADLSFCVMIIWVSIVVFKINTPALKNYNFKRSKENVSHIWELYDNLQNISK